MTETRVHTVEDLPDVYTIVEVATGAGVRFIPKLHGQPFTSPAGNAWFTTYDAAVAMLYEFIGRMQ